MGARTAPRHACMARAVETPPAGSCTRAPPAAGRMWSDSMMKQHLLPFMTTATHAASAPAPAASFPLPPLDATQRSRAQAASCSCLTDVTAASSAATATTGARSPTARPSARRTRSSRVRRSPWSPSCPSLPRPRARSLTPPPPPPRLPALLLLPAVGTTEKLNCYYAHADQDDGLQVRCAPPPLQSAALLPPACCLPPPPLLGADPRCPSPHPSFPACRPRHRPRCCSAAATGS